MSDVKPKRTAREPGRSAVSAAEPVSTETAPIVPAAIVPDAIVPLAPAAAEAVSLAPEAVGQLALPTVPATRDPLTDSADDWAGDPWTAVAEAQATLARGFAAVAVALTGVTGSGIAAAGDAAIALAGARTFSEAVEISAGLARRGVDAMIEGSAKLSEIGVTVVSEASRPMLSRLGGTWNGVPAG